MKNQEQQTLSADEMDALSSDRLEKVIGGALGGSAQYTVEELGIPWPDRYGKFKIDRLTQFENIAQKFEGFPQGVRP